MSRWEARFREPGGGDRGPAEALAAARDLPDGEPRVTELERVTSAAETAGDLRTALDARFALIDAYLRQGERWRLFEPVRRCREVLDRLPELAGERGAELRRYQRFAVEAVFATPRVGLDQARSALDDLARSALDDLARSALDDLARDADGAHEASDLVAELRCRLADHLGDEPAARRWYDRWRTAPPDPATGCPGCAPSRRAELLAGWGEWAAALAELRSLLDDRPPVRPSHCTDQPEAALAAALLPLLRAGEPEQAARAHVEAYRRHRRERTAFPYLAAHLRFCALGGHLDRGLDILAEQLPRLDHPSDDMAVMEFSTAGALLCALATEAGRGDRRMPTPGADDGANGDTDSGTDSGTDDGANGDVDVARLGGLLAELATGLAGSFDARNGTGHQSGRIAARLAERPIAGPVSLPADEAGGDGDAAEPEDELDQDEPGALTINMITAALDRRGDAWTVRGPTVVGRWDPAVIEFRQAGERGEILHVRVLATRRLPAGRRAEAYAFCNVWNHDRLLPKAYAHDDDGELVLAGDVTCDLAHGVAPAQLDVLVTAAVTTGVAYAEAVAELP
nr:YbjN domain-containing protein [Micromonospora sp. RTGN7]